MAEKARAAGGARPVVLVCEDDAAMRELVASVISRLDVEVVQAESSQHALDYLENHDVALLVTDLRMPRVDGLELDLGGLDGYPVAIAHGSLDPVIPADFGREARDALTAAGADVLYRESPLPHTIDPRVLPELRALVSAAIL